MMTSSGFNDNVGDDSGDGEDNGIVDGDSGEGEDNGNVDEYMYKYEHIVQWISLKQENTMCSI